jgi:hypothetical protein
MEAYIVEEPGGSFRKTDLARPALGPNHVLVRIKASGVNPLDTKIRAAKASQDDSRQGVWHSVWHGGRRNSRFVLHCRETPYRSRCELPRLGNTFTRPAFYIRGATYSGVFTLLPLITGEGRAHHGEILAEIGALVERGKLKPLLNERAFSSQEIAAAHSLVESGALGKVVVDIWPRFLLIRQEVQCKNKIYAARAPFADKMCDFAVEFHPEIVSFHFGLPVETLILRRRSL